jgi:hypothetical protein
MTTAMPAGDGAGPSPLLAAYRRFLAEPQVENEFHRVRALLHRTRSAAEERRRLGEAAAAAEVEAGRTARAHDPDGARHLGFATGTVLAAALAAADAVPAYLAAQAFGADVLTTAGITALLVVAIATAMWAAAHYHTGWRRWLVLASLGAGLVALGALRWWYLFVTAGDETAAVLEAMGLTIFTTLLVWLGVVVLGFTKARQVSRAEANARALRRSGGRAAAAEAAVGAQGAAALREFTGRAQVFSSRELDDEESRARFVESVRVEVER